MGNSRVIWIAALCLLITGCGSSTVPSSSNITETVSAATSSSTPRLHREGRYLVDEKNRVVLLHGVNAVWKLKPYFPPDIAEGFSAADADFLAAHGLNTVRLGTLFAGVMPQQGVLDPTYLVGVDRVVQLLAARGIWVMLDFHQDMYNEKFQGEGFPDWSVYDDGIPHPHNFGFPANYFTPEVSRSFDNLWGNHNQIWDHYRNAWKAVATKWKDQPYLMGYDLINEPWPGTDIATCANPAGCPLHDDMKLQALQSHALKGIREADSNNLVWFEPNVIFNDGAKSNLGLITPLTDTNLGFSYHKYCLQAGLLHAQGFTGLPGCDVQHGMVDDNAEEAAARIGAAPLVTEFGASNDQPDITAITALLDGRFTGWQYWHYKGWHDPTSEDPTGAVQSMFTNDADLSTVKTDKLKLLSRTYPQYTAGVPVALSFNPDTAEFNYSYMPRAASGPTEIFVPVALHYPTGYTLQVTGATVTSADNAARLLLENQAGASQVTVHIIRK